MKILISGGNFINKGAEAMLFTAVSECFKMFKSPTFILQLPEGFVGIRSLDELVSLSAQQGCASKPSRAGKIGKLRQLVDAYRSADIMLDISGLELCSKLGAYPSLRYLFKIAIAKWFDTQVFLRPQSFGPFVYGKGAKQLLVESLIRHYIKYPAICFAREKDGYDELKSICPKANVRISSDMVLQNKAVESLLQREDMGLESLPAIKEKSIGFIPNKRMYEQYGKEKPFGCYLQIASEILKCGYNIYLVCHANDDKQIAYEIKRRFNDDQRVIVVDQILSCFQYQALAAKFDFVVASRYHSIVHAFKAHTPAIAIGWAVKYKELLSALRQERYLLNITDTDEKVCLTVGDMVSNHGRERETIKLELDRIQKENCFSAAKECLG